MHQSVGLAGKRHMGNGGGRFAAEEQQITGTNSIDWDRGSAGHLLGRIAGEAYASGGKSGLNQAGAVHAPGSYSPPHVGAAPEMLECSALRRLGASAGDALLELSYAASYHPSLPPVGEADHIPIQNDPGAQGDRQRSAVNPYHGALTPGVYLGTPLLANRILHLGQVSKMDPPVVGVCVGPDPSPLAGPLQHSSGLSQNQLGHLFGAGGGLRHDGRQRRPSYYYRHGSGLIQPFPVVPSSSNPDTT